MRLKVTATQANPYTKVNQISIPTTVNPALWVVGDATITLDGPGPTDEIHIVRVSDGTELYTFTGSGTKSFTVGANFDTEVYFRRELASGTILMRTLPATQRLNFGNNGIVPMFYGAEVQLAQASTLDALDALIQSRLDVAVSTRLATSAYTAPTAAPTAAANAAAVRTELAAELGRIDTTVSSREAESAAATRAAANQAEHDATQTAVAGVGGGGGLDAAGVRAALGMAAANLDDQLTALPTNAELTTALAGADDATLAAIAALPAPPSATAVASATRTELATELARLDAAVGSRLAATAYVAAPTLAEVEASTVLAKEVTVAAKASQASVNALPSASANAAAVRTNLAAEMARLDAPISGVPEAVMQQPVESGFSLARVLRIMVSVLAGKITGGPATFSSRNLGDTETVVTGTADESGNRQPGTYGP